MSSVQVNALELLKQEDCAHQATVLLQIWSNREFTLLASCCLVMVMKRHLGLLFLFSFIPVQIPMDSTSLPCQKAWSSQLCHVFCFL